MRNEGKKLLNASKYQKTKLDEEKLAAEFSAWRPTIDQGA